VTKFFVVVTIAANVQ